MKFKNDIAYLTALYNKFNETNLQLQGDDLNLIKAKATNYFYVRVRTCLVARSV
jgi:hypothetical protein